jgi:glucose-1-phosphate cytidylyltransferase
MVDLINQEFGVKVAILAGGLGTRLSEETDVRPKPMVEVGGQPIIWHILKHYERYGFSEFCVALGYRGEIIKRYFLEYKALSGSMTVSLEGGTVTPIDGVHERWTVHLLDTGNETNTGGRVGRLAPWLRDGTFMLTYGDGLSDVDLDALLEFHRAHGKFATVTAVHPPSRFGEMVFGDAGDTVRFTEKPQMGEGWINGGFMVLEPEVLELVQDDSTSFEGEVLEHLSAQGQLVAYRHESFWQCVDTLRDLRHLQGLWEAGSSPWVTWE